jgi:hypothetical protein
MFCFHQTIIPLIPSEYPPEIRIHPSLLVNSEVTSPALAQTYHKMPFDSIND